MQVTYHYLERPWVYKEYYKIWYWMSMYVCIKVDLFKVICPNGIIIGYTWSILSVNGVSSSWTRGLDRRVNVEKSIQPSFISYLYYIWMHFGAYTSLSQIELSVYNIDVRWFALIVPYLAKISQ